MKCLLYFYTLYNRETEGQVSGGCKVNCNFFKVECICRVSGECKMRVGGAGMRQVLC